MKEDLNYFLKVSVGELFNEDKKNDIALLFLSNYGKLLVMLDNQNSIGALTWGELSRNEVIKIKDYLNGLLECDK